MAATSREAGQEAAYQDMSVDRFYGIPLVLQIAPGNIRVYCASFILLLRCQMGHKPLRCYDCRPDLHQERLPLTILVGFMQHNLLAMWLLPDDSASPMYEPQ